MTELDDRKRRRVRLLQRYLINPWTIVGVHLGVASGYVLVETTGRKTGKRRRSVVGMHREGTTGWVVAEQGRHAGYVRNIEANPQVRVLIDRHWRRARAQTVPEDEPLERLHSFGRERHASNVQRFGTDLLTLRFDLDQRWPVDERT